MNDRNSIIKNERYSGYLMGAGVALMILALLLEGLGTIENGTTTGSVFVIGLALFLLGLLTWLYMFKPWERFDDLKTPHYPGEHGSGEVKAAVTEAAKAAKAVAEDSAKVAADAAAKVSAAAPDAGALATVPTPQKAIEPHVIQMPPPKVEAKAETAAQVVVEESAQVGAKAETTIADAAQAAAGAVKDTAAVVVGAAESVKKEIVEVGKPDDLTIIEGIGPKTNKALQAAGVTTFAALAAMAPAAISALLAEAKVRIVSPPDTWPQQAKLAADGDMDGLKALQAKLKGGMLKD